MRRYLKHIGVALAMTLMVSVSCKRQEARVIPRAQLADIYTEMLMTDQWILSTSGLRMVADTSLVYAPILEKYGYTVEDYVRTVDEYMNDPERFARILRTSSEKLTARLEDLREQKRLQEERQKKERELERLREMYKTDFKAEEFFPYMSAEPYIHYYDSLAFEPDSLLNVYRLKAIERADTLYDCIRMVIPGEMTEVTDTVGTVVPEKPVMLHDLDSIPPPKRPLKRPAVLQQGVKLPEKHVR